MATHLITYDLKAPGRDYTALYDAIKAAPNWAHPVESVWLITTTLTTVQVRDALKGVMDSNDRLLVVDVSNDVAAWKGLPTNISDWLLKYL